MGQQPEAAALVAEQGRLALEALRLVDWRMIWAIPAGLAALILLLFVALFREEQQKS